MDCYIAELDEKSRIAAVWMTKKGARMPKVFDPHKHVFDPQATCNFVGAPKAEIVNWLQESRHGI